MVTLGVYSLFSDLQRDEENDYYEEKQSCSTENSYANTRISPFIHQSPISLLNHNPIPVCAVAVESNA
jgi:hypothetical protein